MKRAKIIKGRYNDNKVWYAVEITKHLKGINEYLWRVFCDWKAYWEIIIDPDSLKKITSKEFEDIIADEEEIARDAIIDRLTKEKKQEQNAIIKMRRKILSDLTSEEREARFIKRKIYKELSPAKKTL
jgi:hypothetical protein